MQILDRPGPTEGMALLQPNADALAVLDDLSRPLEERLYGPIAEAGYSAPPPVLTKRPAPLEVRYTNRETTLTAAHWARDPILTDQGEIGAPDKELERLHRLDNAGIKPELVWVLRELPGTWRPNTRPPEMTGVTTRRDNEQRYLQTAATAFAVGREMLYVAAASAAAVVAGAVALGSIAIAGAAAGARAAVTAPLADGLDPIVLGGIVHPETGAVAWVPLAAWDEAPDVR